MICVCFGHQSAVGPVLKSIDRLAHVCTVRPRAHLLVHRRPVKFTMRNARCIRKRSEICLWLLHTIGEPSALVAFYEDLAALDPPGTQFLHPSENFETTPHTQTKGSRNRGDRGHEGLHRRYQREESQFSDRSYRIHTVIHM